MKKHIFISLCLITCSLLMSAQKSNITEVNSKAKTNSKVNSNSSDVTWMSPTNSDLQNSIDEISLGVIIYAASAVERGQVTVSINGKPIAEKADKVKLKELGKKKKKYEYQRKIQLKEGKNNVQIIVQQDGKKMKSLVRFFENKGGKITEIGGLPTDGSRGIYWESPKWSATPIFKDDRQFKIKARINSNVAIKKENVYVLRKGFHKILPSDDSILERVKDGEYIFTTTIQLEGEGYEDFAVKVKPAMSESFASEPITINFTPFRPNVHLLSIGTLTDLKYTVDDAKDFADLYSNQSSQVGGGLFSRVNTHQLLGEEATAISIKSEIELLETKYLNKEIGAKDLIVLYLSSHGFIDANQELRIQGSDYDRSRWRSTSVSYKRDIQEILAGIPCKKLIFIDACYSGGSKSNNTDIDKEIETLNKTVSGFTTIVSSKGDEASYEDDKWRNGAFTEIIVKGLKYGAADKNNNRLITINELWAYLKENVPAIVWNIKRKGQHPKLLVNDLGDATIYALK